MTKALSVLKEIHTRVSHDGIWISTNHHDHEIHLAGVETEFGPLAAQTVKSFCGAKHLSVGIFQDSHFTPIASVMEGDNTIILTSDNTLKDVSNVLRSIHRNLGL